jgi:hypothetical protein
MKPNSITNTAASDVMAVKITIVLTFVRELG